MYGRQTKLRCDFQGFEVGRTELKSKQKLWVLTCLKLLFVIVFSYFSSCLILGAEYKKNAGLYCKWTLLFEPPAGSRDSGVANFALKLMEKY